jgi:hypothetical protein
MKSFETLIPISLNEIAIDPQKEPLVLYQLVNILTREVVFGTPEKQNR